MRTKNPHPELDPEVRETVGQAMGRLPSGIFVLTAACGEKRTGIIVSFVQQACINPPMVTVAIRKGRPIMPLISESRQFALCQLAEDDRLMLRKFAKFNNAAVTEDPFPRLRTVRGHAPQPAHPRQHACLSGMRPRHPYGYRGRSRPLCRCCPRRRITTGRYPATYSPAG